MGKCKSQEVSTRHAVVELDNYLLTFRLKERDTEPKWVAEWKSLILTMAARTDITRTEEYEQLVVPKAIFRKAKQFALKRIQIEIFLEDDFNELRKKLAEEERQQELFELKVQTNEHTHPVD